MDIFGGKCLKDIIRFYDSRGNKTMIKKINDLVTQIEEDLDPDYKYVEIDSSGEEEEEVEREVVRVKKSHDGFYSLE